MKFKDKVKYLKRIFKHKIAFAKVEKQLLDKMTIRSITHDIDKIPLILFTNKTRAEIHHAHRSRNKHHAEFNHMRSKSDLLEMIIDWECARYTKPDQQRNAYHTLKDLHPEMVYAVKDLMVDLGLWEGDFNV